MNQVVSGIYTRAVVPTNSLVLMDRMAGRRLPDLIQRIYASSQMGMPSLKIKPHRYLTHYTKRAGSFTLKFNRGTAHEPLDVEEIIEKVTSLGGGDLWIHELILRLNYHRSDYDFCFHNKPVTHGSEAERWIMNYLIKMRMMGHLKLVQVRHLPLECALTVPRGAQMSPEYLEDPSFIKWLGGETGGLVKMKLVKSVDGHEFIDVSIRE